MREKTLTIALNTPRQQAARIVAVATDKVAMGAMSLGAVRAIGLTYLSLEGLLRGTLLPNRANVFGLDGKPENAWTAHCREHNLSTDHSLFNLINS